MIGQRETHCACSRFFKRTLTVLIVFAVGGSFDNLVAADETGRYDYVLTHVAVGVKDAKGFKAPISIEANASGGIVLSNFKTPPDCTEDVQYKWHFNKDIRHLKSSETFDIDLQVITSNCRGNASGPMAEVFGLGSSRPSKKIYPTLSAVENREIAERDGMPVVSKETEIWGKPARGQNRKVGQGVVKMRANPGPNSNDRPWFTLLLSGESRKGDGRVNDDFLEVRVAYIYKLLKPGESPGAVEIVYDHPGADSSSIITLPDFPTGDSTGDSGPRPGGYDHNDNSRDPGSLGDFLGDDCLNPDVQRCIDLWIELATQLRNRNEPQLGPWRVSQYGQWINANIIRVQPPDGWDTKYHRSRYCVTWIESVTEHQHPAYGGQLPALRDYVSECLEGRADNLDIDALPGNRTGQGNQRDPSDPGGGRLGNLNLTINYPTVQLELVNATIGQVESSTLLQMNTDAPGVVRVGLADQQGVVGEYTLCRLDFMLRGSPGDTATVTGDVPLANRIDNSSVIFVVQAGQIRVLRDTVPGDFNGDGAVTSLDALAALRMSIGSLPVQMVMDVDNDGQVTAKDARLIMGMAVGAQPTAPLSLFGDRAGDDPNRIPPVFGPTIIIGSASKASGEVVSIPVTLHYH